MAMGRETGLTLPGQFGEFRRSFPRSTTPSTLVAMEPTTVVCQFNEGEVFRPSDRLPESACLCELSLGGNRLVIAPPRFGEVALRQSGPF